MPRQTVEDISLFFDEITDHNYLCKGCGVCAGSCPTGSLTMEQNPYSEYIASFDKTSCVACGKCIVVCPGRELFKLTDTSPLGKHLGVYLAHANDVTAREKGSSGGVISALADFALSRGYADKAIMLSNSSSPVNPQPVIARTGEQVLDCASSKYVYYPIGDQLKSLQENSIITALPCQAAGIRRCSSRGLIFGLFCSKAATSELLTYVARKESIDKDEITSVNFRHGNWPGEVLIKTSSREIRIPYNRSYYTAAFNSSIFAPQGCLFCNDYSCDKADISFGDPWSKKNKELSGQPGKSVVIIRTQRGQELFEKALASGVITARVVPAHEIVNGHTSGIFSKRAGLKTRLNWLEKRHSPVPVYHKEDLITSSCMASVWEYFYIYNTFYFKKGNRWAKALAFSRSYMFYRRFAVVYVQRFFIKRTKFARKLVSGNAE